MWRLNPPLTTLPLFTPTSERKIYFMPAQLSIKRLSPLTIDILDAISDGQWHPYNKIAKPFLSRKEPDKGTEVATALEELVTGGYLIEGEKSSYRLPDKYVRQWRNKRGLSLETRDSRSPRYFGGVLEDEGWAKAPLKPCNLLHFRAESHVDAATIAALLTDTDAKVSQDEDGLLRITTLRGTEVYRLLKEAGKNDPSLKITGVRLNINAKRRNLDELPPRFIDDLCSFYGSFAKILLRRSMSSITKHIADPEDQQQQIYLWILDAVARYDEKTCIPFAAYLSTVLQKWVHNLNRKAHGRSAADNELKHSRAVTAFEASNGRKPTISELADLLGETVDKVSKDAVSIQMVSNLRSMTTLDSEDFSIPLVARENSTEMIEQELEKTVLSAALVSTALEQGDANDDSLAALFAIVDKVWNRDKSLAALYKNVPAARLAAAELRLMDTAGAKIREAYAA